MSSEDVKLRVMLKPLTKGWSTASEPLGPKSRVSLDFGGGLNVKVKLAEVLPNTEYSVGLNVYGTDMPTFGGVPRCAFHPGRTVLDGVSKEDINQYELGTVTSNAKGKTKLRTILPVNEGSYDVQVWVTKGRATAASPVCYKSGRTFGDSDLLTAYTAASCQRTPLSFVVTGCGRSGTGFTSRVLSMLGFPCEHEKVFSLKAITGDSIELSLPEQGAWGDSSCMAAPMLDRLPPNTVVFHQVRNPIKVVRSAMGCDFFQRPYNPFTKLVMQYLPQIAPDEPRLQFVGSYSSSDDVAPVRTSGLERVVFGEASQAAATPGSRRRARHASAASSAAAA